MEYENFKDFYEEKLERFELLDEGSSEEDFKIPTSILWEDFDKQVFPEQSWRVKNLIPKEGFVILASISGNRKTWLGMDLANDISWARDFLGESNFKTEGCNVLYINGENSKSEMHRRGKQLGLGAGSSPFELHLVNTDNLNLNKDEGALWLKAYVEFYKIGVVFIDTFIAVAGGLKEDKAEEIRQFFNRFNSLKNSGVAIVWLMHMRKPTHQEGKVPKKEQLLGSQDKSASVEVLLMLQSEPGSEEINVYQRKNRVAVEIKPFKIDMKDTVDSNGRKITTLGYGGEIEEEVWKKEQAKGMILIFLEDDGRTTKEILAFTKKEVGEKNTREALKDLISGGHIQMGKQGRENYYFLPKEVKESENLDVTDFGTFNDQ